MGAPMTARLLEAGCEVAVADLSEPALGAFRGRASATSQRPGELEGELVITMLPTDRHVRAALFESGGALERPREAVIDMSSAAPRGTLAIAEQLRERGVSFLDAPVSGGVPRAKTGELTTMVGGDAVTVERYRPILAHMCATIHHVGAQGAGVTMKALNNYLSASALWAACEALVVGARAGLDPRMMVEVWRTSTARSHSVDVKIPLAVLPRTFDYGFTLGLLAKDLGIAAQLSREQDVATPMLAQTHASFALAAEALGAGTDMTAVIQLIEGWADFTVPAVSAVSAGSAVSKETTT